jgi:hypothetical protein
VFEVGLARLRFRSGNSDVMVPAHRFSLSVDWHKFYAVVAAFTTICYWRRSTQGSISVVSTRQRARRVGQPFSRCRQELKIRRMCGPHPQISAAFADEVVVIYHVRAKAVVIFLRSGGRRCWRVALSH